MATCEYCGGEFVPKRGTAKYCSAKCRVYSGRVSVTPAAPVTVSDCYAKRRQKTETVSRNKLSAADLPVDVQAEIDKHCAENNGGNRAATHSRSEMTRRALAYQSMFGRRSSSRAGDVESVEAADGPLDVYSPERWSRLAQMGYVWRAESSRGWHEQRRVWAVPVPGDPAYGEVSVGLCSCGKATPHIKVAKCLTCVGAVG